MSITAYHFWSPTCGPCKVIKPAVNDLKEEFDQINWVSVDIQNDPQNYTGEFAVKVVPTIVVLSRESNGKILYVGKESGTVMSNYYRLIRSGIRAIS